MYFVSNTSDFPRIAQFQLLIQLKRENEPIKYKIIRDIKTLFEKDDDYYIPVKVGNYWNNSYVEHESNDDKNKNLLVK